MSDSEPIPSPQNNEAEPSTAKKPSLIWAIVISISIFVLLLPFPIGSYFVNPKFKVIFADMLGPDETLPELTLLTLKVSDTLNNNAFILLPVYLIFSLVCAGFIGFNRFFLSRKISMIVTVLASVLFFLVWLGLLFGSIIALQLPLIKMMDKLGQ
jgi:hypothetical protein